MEMKIDLDMRQMQAKLDQIASTQNRILEVVERLSENPYQGYKLHPVKQTDKESLDCNQI